MLTLRRGRGRGLELHWNWTGTGLGLGLRPGLGSQRGRQMARHSTWNSAPCAVVGPGLATVFTVCVLRYLTVCMCCIYCLDLLYSAVLYCTVLLRFTALIYCFDLRLRFYRTRIPYIPYMYWTVHTVQSDVNTRPSRQLQYSTVLYPQPPSSTPSHLPEARPSLPAPILLLFSGLPNPPGFKPFPKPCHPNLV